MTTSGLRKVIHDALVGHAPRPAHVAPRDWLTQMVEAAVREYLTSDEALDRAADEICCRAPADDRWRPEDAAEPIVRAALGDDEA